MNVWPAAYLMDVLFSGALIEFGFTSDWPFGIKCTRKSNLIYSLCMPETGHADSPLIVLMEKMEEKSKTIQFSKCGSQKKNKKKNEIASSVLPFSVSPYLVPHLFNFLPDSMAQSVAHKRNSFTDFLLKAFFELSWLRRRSHLSLPFPRQDSTGHTLRPASRSCSHSLFFLSIHRCPSALCAYFLFLFDFLYGRVPRGLGKHRVSPILFVIVWRVAVAFGPGPGPCCLVQHWQVACRISCNPICWNYFISMESRSSFN